METGYDVSQLHALVDQGYHLRLGEHAALAGDGCGILPFERQLRQPLKSTVEDPRHGFKEPARPCSTAVVHNEFQHFAILPERHYLAVLPTDIHHCSNSRREPLRPPGMACNLRDVLVSKRHLESTVSCANDIIKVFD